MSNIGFCCLARCLTGGITCEAHIDDAADVLGHLQTRRFAWCLPSPGVLFIPLAWERSELRHPSR
jgi:hypothetical protein